MRQGNQNRRGRGNRPRKNSNPASRNYESNGPDVKIRGSAAHIAGKYSALARDARSAGDPVSSENYWQHAEHYNRIVQSAEAQAQSKPQGSGANGGQRPKSKDGSAAASDNQQNTAANGTGKAGGGDTQQAADKGTDEAGEAATAKPARKRAKPGARPNAKAAAAKTETATTEDAG